MAFFISGQILVLFWTVFYIFERLAPTESVRWIIVCIEYFPLSYVGYVFMHFSYAYTRHKMMDMRLFFLSLVLPTFNYLAILTNPLHHTFYYEFTIESEVFGPLTYLTIATTFIYLIIGAMFFLSKKHVITENRQRQSMYFVIAILIPVVAHAMHTTGLFDFGFTITHVFIPFSILLFIVSVLKYQFLDILPIAVNDTIEGMNEGMLVISEKGELIDHNLVFFKKLFGTSVFNDIKDFQGFIDIIESRMSEKEQLNQLKDAYHVKANVNVVKGSMKVKNFHNSNVYIYYAAKPIHDYNKNKIATLLTFFDMTEIYELSRKLEEKNIELTEANIRLQNHTQNMQQLTMETERNTIMADIHDTLGHSMMELLTLLEVTDLMIDQEEENVEDTINEAIEKGRNSLSEIRSAVMRYKKMGGVS